jgi:hypothetical protein
MKEYGVRVYREGVDFHLDRRIRDVKGEAFVIPSRYGHWAYARRGAISGLSRASSRRLEFIAANLAIPMGWMITLTYRENPRQGETDEARNYRVAKRSKSDLNRFLTCLRNEIGGYVWVQEFQERGVVHYHVLCEREVTEQRVRLVWCRAIGALDDNAALSHGVRVEAVTSPTGARSYVGRYFGKQRQKQLPNGVSGAGRWWGRSRGLALALAEEVVTSQAKAQDNNRVEVWVTRQVRRYLTRRFGRKFRGGFFVDWGGTLCEALTAMIARCRSWFMDYCDREDARVRRVVERGGWEFIEKPVTWEGEVSGESCQRDMWARLIDLGLDPEAVERARTRWQKRDRPRRRGLWADYWLTNAGIGDEGRGSLGLESAQLRADLGETQSGSERDAA